MNAWAAKILEIPVQKIKLNKYAQKGLSKKARKDPKSLQFTLDRVHPLTMLKQKESITQVPLDFPVSIIDKPKYAKNEISLVIFKLLHRNSHKVLSIDNVNTSNNVQASMFLLKNVNEGRNAAWDNYCYFKGTGMPSYIKYKSKYDVK